MKLIVFEYSSISSDNSLINEGLNMLKGLLDDLNKLTFDTYYLINEKFDNFNYNNCKALYLNTKLEKWLLSNIKNFDYCLFIAPEDDRIQYNLTKLIENKVKLLCSNSIASFICSSKYLTYENTPQDILKIKTMKIDIDDLKIDLIKKLFPDFNFIVKPDNRTSSELIYRVLNENEFYDVMNYYKKCDVNEILIQEYIPGIPVSVSVICKESYVNCISVNSQEIHMSNNNLKYVGCVTPITHELNDELFSISSKIIKNIPGLKGFCGIDYIIHEDKIYFVEINSRVTTPFIVLQKKCKENLTEKIINLLIYDEKDKITFEKSGSFRKGEII